jgi:hypothetical protein
LWDQPLKLDLPTAGPKPGIPRAVFLARAQGSATGEEGQVDLDGLVGVDDFVGAASSDDTA